MGDHAGRDGGRNVHVWLAGLEREDKLGMRAAEERARPCRVWIALLGHDGGSDCCVIAVVVRGGDAARGADANGAGLVAAASMH
jgi:hypothetical protein